MQRVALSVCLAFVLLAAHCAETTPTKNPATKPQKPPPDDTGFDLSDALGDENEPTQPQHPADHPGDHGNTGGGFSDSDLFDGPLPPEKPQGDASESAPEGGMLAGIISSVVVAVVGAVSSFIAYQKKKLCFKASDQENVNMESQQGAHSEPPVQRTLLQKS